MYFFFFFTHTEKEISGKNQSTCFISISFSEESEEIDSWNTLLFFNKIFVSDLTFVDHKNTDCVECFFMNPDEGFDRVTVAGIKLKALESNFYYPFFTGSDLHFITFLFLILAEAIERSLL
jgi:hypothetical protein